MVWTLPLTIGIFSSVSCSMVSCIVITSEVHIHRVYERDAWNSFFPMTVQDEDSQCMQDELISLQDEDS